MLGLMYILILPTPALPASILLATTQIISLIVNMTHQTMEESENPGKHHDDDGIINDDAKDNELEYNEDFYGFHNNQDVTSKGDWRAMMISMGFTRMWMLPARLTSYIWMR